MQVSKITYPFIDKPVQENIVGFPNIQYEITCTVTKTGVNAHVF